MIVAVVGLPGSGKSTVTKQFVAANWQLVYCGDVVFDSLKKEGLEINEENERKIREKLRAEHGISAIEDLALPNVRAAHQKGNVVVESFYTWESYKKYKDAFGDDFQVLAIHASPSQRAQRLATRKARPLTEEQTRSRTYSQIENLHQAGPIAAADFHIVNMGALGELQEKVALCIATLCQES